MLFRSQKDKNKDPMDRSVIILPSRNNFRISCKENKEISEAILKDQAEPYFELNNGPITVYPVSSETVDKQNGTILTQLWFGNLVSGSAFDGYRFLVIGNRVRGVRLEHETQKISESSLDSKVQAALNSGLAFEYNGILYVPSTGKGISLKK